ncbi:MAG: nuclear transport factor 2 family protein [Novosphingobium sp.]|nr:nuclear transport factor 2 family protein [Novosphingobium sp.]MCP5402269.1 nuclear transport factor 2 family protein [Novosphingobium sp.]
MNDIERLLAIEEIKQVKARYFYGLDHKDWDLWRREVWAPDGRLEVPEAGMVLEPFDTVIEWVSQSVGDQVSVHHGHMPIIEFTSDTMAKVIWAMEDRLYRTREFPLEDGSTYLHGFGHYRETYVKTDAGWRIQSSQLTRLRVEMTKVSGMPGEGA